MFPISHSIRTVAATALMCSALCGPSLAATAAPSANSPASPAPTTIAARPAGTVDPAPTNPAGAPAPRPGSRAPDFTLPDAAGKTHSLSQYQGKWVVLEWVNYDCPFVKKHYGSGNMQNTQRAARDKGVIWLSINSSAPGKQGYFEGAELAQRMADLKAAPDAYLQDPEGKVGMEYQAKTTPTMFVINPQGKVIYSGAIDDKPSADPEDIPGATNYVNAALTSGMAVRPVRTALTQSYGCGVKYR